MEYRIGDFSQISRLSIRTLHYYQELGLLWPTRTESDTGYRYYDEKLLERVKIIQEFKDLDFSLKDIKEIIDSCAEDGELAEFLRRKAKEVEQKIAFYKDVQAKINILLRKGRDIAVVQTVDIMCKDIPAILVCSIRYKGKYQDIGKYLGKLYKVCGRHAAGAPIALYYDPEYKEDEADIEVCVPVKKEISAGECHSKWLPGGRAVTLIHRGPYEAIGWSYKQLIDYINENEIKVTIPSREIYLKGPGLIFRGNPEHYQTEIQMMIE